MKILAIDTSTQACSVALLFNDEIKFTYKYAPKQHGSLILPMINDLLVDVGLSLKQLDAFALTIGPGGFTGVRLAVGVVQGLAFATDLPVIPVSTLAVLAQGAYREHKASLVLSMLDARMQQVYFGGYALNEKGLMTEVISEEVIFPQDIIISEHDNWVGVGSGWDSYQDILKAKLEKKVANIYPKQTPHAQDILPLAMELFNQGQIITAENVLPVYLRDKVV